MSTISLFLPKQFEVAYLKVSAEVRYWEDSRVNGELDKDGTKIPSRNGNLWEPVIELTTGRISGWPGNTTARIHYKVCDAGLYFLLDSNMQPVAKWKEYYVPDDILCPGGDGNGDYIIFNVGPDGVIPNWFEPVLDADEWECVEGGAA